MLGQAFDIARKVGTAFAAFFEDQMMVSSNEDSVFISSNTEDMIYNGDIHKSLESLCDLHRELTEVLPSLPNVFVRPGDAEVGKLTTTNKFVGVTIIYDNGDVTIPSKWFPMLPGEEVISSLGQLYRLTCVDWLFCLLSLGMYYCCILSKRKSLRSALVLTNKRIVELTLHQKSGTVPSNLDNFSVRVTTFLPGNVSGGYMRVTRQKNLEVGINAAAGPIHISFLAKAQKALPFARSLHLTQSRVDAKISNWEDAGAAFDDVHLQILPVLPDERIRARIKNSAEFSLADFQPCCNTCCLLQLWNFPRHICCGPVPYICSKESICCCFPWLPYILTCALRPFIRSQEVIITDSAVIQFIPIRNYGFCCFHPFSSSSTTASTGCCQTAADVIIVWALVSNLTGHEFKIHAEGRESCFRRCCGRTFCGKACCPVGE